MQTATNCELRLDPATGQYEEAKPPPLTRLDMARRGFSVETMKMMEWIRFLYLRGEYTS